MCKHEQINHNLFFQFRHPAETNDPLASATITQGRLFPVPQQSYSTKSGS